MRSELAKEAWLILIKHYPPAECAKLAYDHADAFLAASKPATEPAKNEPKKEQAVAKMEAKCAEIVAAINSASSLKNLEQVWSHHQTAIDYFEKQQMGGDGVWMERIMDAYKPKADQFNELAAG